MADRKWKEKKNENDEEEEVSEWERQEKIDGQNMRKVKKKRKGDREWKEKKKEKENSQGKEGDKERLMPPVNHWKEQGKTRLIIFRPCHNGDEAPESVCVALNV